MNKHRRITPIAILLAYTLLFISVVGILAQEVKPEPEFEETVQECAECHIDVVQSWQTSPHSQSFLNDEFQSTWSETEGSNCLSCHTTGYTAFNGEFTHAAVTCEACHGQTPTNHPDESLIVDSSAEVCADCHTTTYHEWSVSNHAAEDLTCTACHNPHPQQVRFDNDSTALCTNCHENAISEGYAHITHVEQACTACHWHRSDFDPTQHFQSGLLLASGHEALVETQSCISCHDNEETSATITESVSGTIHGNTSDLRLQLSEAKAEAQNAIAIGENTSAVRLIQGLVVGIAIGGILVLVFLRLRPHQQIAYPDAKDGGEA